MKVRSLSSYVYTGLVASALLLSSTPVLANQQPNIILVFADDISARELPLYGSNVWSPPEGGNTQDPQYRAQTPVLDKLADDGCWVTTTWAATVCNPSRAMMMTGRYAHIHKWWTNKDCGEVLRPNGQYEKWPLYESSPLQIGHIAQKSGYGTYWAGKTQMAGDLDKYGFDEGCFTPGGSADKDNPYTDFKHEYKKIDGKRVLINVDTGRVEETYLQHGWNWYPHVKLMHHPSLNEDFGWWPNTDKSCQEYGLHTYGPDVEQDFIFEFMERKHQEGQPFFIYHTTHLGHDAFDWFFPDSPSKWPGTPVIEWDGQQYVRKQPKITGDNGVYDTHGTVTEPGIHKHVEYLDYQMWRYQKKLEEMGIADNTIVIFTADNGTSGYGKHLSEKQKGTHVPLIIYAPGMTKQGEQDILVNLSDFLPTIADIVGQTIPADYEINGESLWPYIMTSKDTHRDWIYAYKGSEQLVRSKYLMKDGWGGWYDVSQLPDDLSSFPAIKNWNDALEIHREERERLSEVMQPFDMHAIEHDAPGTPPNPNARYLQAKKKKKKK